MFNYIHGEESTNIDIPNFQYIVHPVHETHILSNEINTEFLRRKCAIFLTILKQTNNYDIARYLTSQYKNMEYFQFFHNHIFFSEYLEIKCYDENNNQVFPNKIYIEYFAGLVSGKTILMKDENNRYIHSINNIVSISDNFGMLNVQIEALDKYIQTIEVCVTNNIK